MKMGFGVKVIKKKAKHFLFIVCFFLFFFSIHKVYKVSFLVENQNDYLITMKKKQSTQLLLDQSTTLDVWTKKSEMNRKKNDVKNFLSFSVCLKMLSFVGCRKAHWANQNRAQLEEVSFRSFHSSVEFFTRNDNYYNFYK